jgi:hypothetical protein
MIEYPKNIMEFEKESASEKQCRKYLMKLRYADGVYTCPVCEAESHGK